MIGAMLGCADDGVIRESCENLERSTRDLRTGSCTLPATPVVFGGPCPGIWGVRCGTNGAVSSGPSGWIVDCEEPASGVLINCTYNLINNGLDQCTLSGSTATYPAVATNGDRTGLIVLVDMNTTVCEFRDCQN